MPGPGRSTARPRPSQRLRRASRGARFPRPAPGGAAIRGASCPLATVVATHPEACRIVEALLTALTGLEVREACDRTGPPRCCFEVLAGAA